jgi:hypothetical protein
MGQDGGKDEGPFERRPAVGEEEKEKRIIGCFGGKLAGER